MRKVICLVFPFFLAVGAQGAEPRTINIPFASVFAFSTKSSLERLQSAIDTIHRDPAVKRFLGKSTRHALSLADRVTDEEVETTKFQHYFDGIEVVGSRAFHHLGRAGVQVRNVISEFDLDTKPTISVEEAISIARGFVGDRALKSLPVLKVFPGSDDLSARLVYWIVLAPEAAEAGNDVILDAHSGHVIASISHHIPMAPIHVYSADSNIGVYPPPGVIPGVEMSEEQKRDLMARCQVIDRNGMPLRVNVDGCPLVVDGGKIQPSADESARRAAFNSRTILNYFQQTHRRNSYDGRGAPVVSVVHIGRSFDNAFWSSDMRLMAYGDGDGVETKDFTHALDVAGHEMTHGMISQTANLIYMDESGALNEAYADFFGRMIANDGEWVMGRKLFINPDNGGFRNLGNPGALQVKMRDENGEVVSRPYPSKMSERFPSAQTCDRTNDNCWVHVNATIPGHASYLVSQAIGKRKAEKLYYLTLTQYLNERSNFVAAARATQSACAQLFDANTCNKVKAAYEQVGL